MNEQDLQSFRERLEKMRSDLVEDSEETVHEMREENNLYPDPSDRATSETEHINLLRIREATALTISETNLITNARFRPKFRPTIAPSINLRRGTNGVIALPAKLLRATSIKQILQDVQPQPALVHGDLWSGNAAIATDGSPVIFDPAAYYGDREVDIAMTELFGGFPPSFYKGYNEVWQLDAGYSERKDLYNLYHILNHFNLFGGGYGSQAQRIMQRFL